MYNEPPGLINFGTTQAGSIINLFSTFVASYLIDKHGVRTGMIIGLMLSIAGLWVRTFCK